MGLSLNGRPPRYGYVFNQGYRSYYPGRFQKNSKTAADSNFKMSAASKHRCWWYYFTQDTFTKLAFLPRFLVFLVAALMLLSSYFFSSIYSGTNINNSYPNFELQIEHVTGHADIAAKIPDSHNNNDGNRIPASSSSCKWARYADWPYSSEFTGMLSPYRHKLLYVKTPKSSSSTTAHILQRYTSREGLVVGYPNFVGDEWTFQNERSLHDALMRQKVSEFDALVSHIIYHRNAVEEILGTGDSNNGNRSTSIIKRPFRVISVRDPLKRSWSMYMHGISKREAREFALGAKTPLEFAQRLDRDGQLNYAAGYRHGVDPPTPQNVDAHYDHVVVSERVTESFLTLAPKLGLRASDLLFFSQKKHGFARKMTQNNNNNNNNITALDDMVRQKTVLDHLWHRLANRRLENELKLLPDKIKNILNDIPQMMQEVSLLCADIGPEDNSCFSPLELNQTRWDGNQMCLARCIERWAQHNIMCK